ncbi:sulfotransferase [Frigidibacter sp. RF13]|uniref:sulfotransferase n=1 Tax=Frigidibacter sp. RF13 TaxID=2997340 RepID=UPI00226EEF6E|nr:sulfotransferase [Frigidibacter sp. RF13]MCY1126008.1 sulfotransferase [Frigidibacter sp. RF13]
MGCVIAGFHRSGTSSVAQYLTAAGLDPGPDLIGANEWNPYGYFEDWRVTHFHDAVLRRAGNRDWASASDDNIALTPDEEEFIRSYCAGRDAAGRPWLVKDPRMCLVLGDWMALHPALTAVIVFRSPAEACWSIYRREAREVHEADDEIRDAAEPVSRRILSEPDHALKLWVSYNRHLLQALERWPERCTVISNRAFVEGFDLATAVDSRFHYGLSPSATTGVLDTSVLTREVPPLPVQDQVLAERAFDLWSALCAADVGGCLPGAMGDLFETDKGGTVLALALTRLELAGTLRHLPELRELAALRSRAVQSEREKAELEGRANEWQSKAAELAQDVGDLQARVNGLDRKIEIARRVISRLQRWPFRAFFKWHRKYRALIEEFRA